MQYSGKFTFNFSKYELSDCEKKLLAKGLNFSLPPKYLDYADYLVNFELFYRNIRTLGILSNENLNFVKTRTKEAALSSYRNYIKNVIVDKADYFDKMENLLNDTRKFQKINLKNDGILNFAVNKEKRVTIFLKNLLMLIVYLKK